jgi:alanine racemase
MLAFTLPEIAKAVDGILLATPELVGQEIKQIVTDSRSFHKGDQAIFFALNGPVHNAHQYIPELVKKGIHAFVISEESSITEDAAFILVENTLSALQKLAAFNRSEFSYPVIGITGSNGKTIVKEWLHDLLAPDFKIIRSPKSYNSQVGVPLSVLLMHAGFDLAIFEAGISQPGEMQHLSSIILPEIGILTNIGDAHQEFFTSVEQKLKEKLRLFSRTKKLVCRSDTKWIVDVVAEFCLLHQIEPVFWSTTAGSSGIRFTPFKSGEKTGIEAFHAGKNYRFTIPFTDDSAIENACHCFATLTALDLDPTGYLPQFEQLQPIAMRLEIKQGINNCLLINDFYNSDLNSLSIALSVLKQQAATIHSETIVILSDILQTGLEPAELYKKVNTLLVEWGIDRLVGIGTEIRSNKDQFTLNATFFSGFSEFEKNFHPNHFRSAAILLKGARQFRFERISGLLQQKAHQTVLEISVNALIHNLNVFRKLLQPETKIMVMVKAFSYGSGDVEIARVLQYQKVDYLAVAVADEGVQLRNAGISVPVIVMNPEQDSFQNMINFRLEPNIYSLDLLRSFSEAIHVAGLQNFPVHLKIDTGMNRLGLKTEAEIREVISFLHKSDNLRVQSVFSHLAASDEPDLDDFTQSQFDKFEAASDWIRNEFAYKIDRHILNSAGIERFTNKQFEMVRLGIGLYGISQTGLGLENIGTLKSTVSQVKVVYNTETVGYNRKGRLEQKSRIAIVPVGYADGLDRKLGNLNGSAFVNGKRVPIVGNICMDMLMLDVTDVKVSAGDAVEFFGPHISITELARQVGTIPYEILTGISQRVKRIYLQE